MDLIHGTHADPRVLRSGLLHSFELRIAVDMYIQHRLGSTGRCGFCGHDRCRVASNGAKLIVAAGLDPATIVKPNLSGSDTPCPQRSFPARAPGPGIRPAPGAARPATHPSTDTKDRGGLPSDLRVVVAEVNGAIGCAFVNPQPNRTEGGTS